MKSKNKKIKDIQINKYALGGLVHDPLMDYLMIQYQKATNNPNIIENPTSTLADNDIKLAKAVQKTENNPFTQGLDLFGNLAMQTGSSLMNKANSKGQGISKNGFNWGNLLQQGIGAVGTLSNSSFAMGGIANKVPINVEGDEIIETPQGQIAELQGPSHAEGGINLDVPQGTEIYSKRLKGPDGKSMADRKKARERQIAKLEKLVKENPTDKVIKNTLDKTRKDFQIQEQQDMQKMQMMHQMFQMQKTVEHFDTGGLASGRPVIDWTKAGKIFDNEIPTVVNNNDEISDVMYPSTLNLKDTNNNKYEFLNKIFEDGVGLTMGDTIGLGGQLYSTFTPMKNTQANRAGDTPNINTFKDYGKDALHKMDQSKQYINQIRDENLKDLELTRTGQISRNRNSARGINTQRALDLTADANINDTKSKIFGQFAQAMQQIYGQEAGLENDQDVKIMQGEYARDLADRQDRDNYFSQMAQNIATKGIGLQHIGKNVNEIKTRNVTDKVMNQLYNNFGINSMTGGVKAKATEELNVAPNFYKDAHVDTLQKVLNRELIRTGNKLYDIDGNELDKKTLKTISANKKENVKKDTPQISEDILQQVMNFFNR